jgi:hypothetical protein
MLVSKSHITHNTPTTSLTAVPDTFFTPENVEEAVEYPQKFIFDPEDSASQTSPPDTVTTENETAPVTAGVSARGRQQKLSRAMQESIAQKDLYGHTSMNYMAASTTVDNSKDRAFFIDDDQFHDWHLQLQESMSHPIAFHAEMMGHNVLTSSAPTA